MKLILKLRSTLFLAFAVVALVPVLSLSIWLQHTAYTKVLAQVEEKHLLLAKHLSYTLDRYVLDIENILSAALYYRNAEHKTEHDHLAAFDSLSEKMGIEMIAEKMSSGDYAIIFGDEKHKPAIGLEAASEKSTPLSQAHISIPSQTLINQYGSPMLYLQLNKNKSNYYVALSTDFIIELQRSINFGILGHAAIVDSQGNVIAHPKKEWQRSIKNIAKIHPVGEMMKGNSGVSQFYSPALQADMISGYTTVKKTGWGVMVPQPLSELKQEAKNSRMDSLIIAFIGLLIAIFIAYFLTKHLSSPIAMVLESIKRLSDKDFVLAPKENISKIQIKEGNELVKQFYKAALNVKKMQSNLEALVEERTIELQEEITERKKVEEEMRYLATHDFLTGLPNRALFIDKFNDTYHALKKKNNTDSACELCGLLFLDLDNFKSINDEHGHLLGDNLLKLVTTRIVDCVRHNDTVARQSGDEFIVLLADLASSDTLKKVATKIINNIESPYLINGQKVTTGASIGGIIIDKKTTLTPEEIIQKADILMYESKKKGGNIITIHNSTKASREKAL